MTTGGVGEGGTVFLSAREEGEHGTENEHHQGAPRLCIPVQTSTQHTLYHPPYNLMSPLFPQCNYIAEQPSELCRKQAHPLSRHKALKRWFECQECRERCCAYNARYPPFACRYVHCYYVLFVSIYKCSCKYYVGNVMVKPSSRRLYFV